MVIHLAYQSVSTLQHWRKQLLRVDRGKGERRGPSEMSFIFSKACAAFLKGPNETSFTSREKAYKSNNVSRNSFERTPISSDSVTWKREYPAADSFSRKSGTGILSQTAEALGIEEVKI